METWEEARINRLEDRIDRLERKDWERRDFILRFLAAAMIVLSVIAVVVSATHPAH